MYFIFFPVFSSFSAAANPYAAGARPVRCQYTASRPRFAFKALLVIFLASVNVVGSFTCSAAGSALVAVEAL